MYVRVCVYVDVCACVCQGGRGGESLCVHAHASERASGRARVACVRACQRLSERARALGARERAGCVRACEAGPKKTSRANIKVL